MHEIEGKVEARFSDLKEGQAFPRPSGVLSAAARYPEPPPWVPRTDRSRFLEISDDRRHR